MCDRALSPSTLKEERSSCFCIRGTNYEGQKPYNRIKINARMLLAMQISKLVGQIISLRLSIGNVAMRQTRYIEITVASSTSSDKNKFSQRKAKDEVLFCKRFFTKT